MIALRRLLRSAAMLLAVFAVSAAPLSGAQAQSAADGALALQVLREEIAIGETLARLGAAPAPEVVVVRNVRVVDPADASVRDRQSIVVSLGAIFWVGDTNAEPEIGDALVIDGRGLYAAPGLTDMHVHSASASSWLLNLANGVTTLREMDGFPWMLAAREAAREGRLLAPTSYVAGTIINYLPFENFFVTARDAITARRIVRQQAACGYDFVKVHNVLPERVFDVVAAQARESGLDLVGHVPHRMRVRHAVEQGMRTMEHLKGFIDDRTLTLGDTDYDAAVGPNVWVTPTFYAYRRSVEEERAAYDAVGAYVPARVRAEWRALAATPDDEVTRLNRNVQVLGAQIVRELAARRVHFLAGTDAANYPFQAMGFALVEEMRLLTRAGLAPADAVRAATTAPAQAMRAERDFGRIAPGMRADIVLLARNPLENAGAYAQNQGVMVRGRWLERAALDGALAELTQLYADGRTQPRLTRAGAEALAGSAEALVANGFVFNPRILVDADAALRRAGYAPAAARLAALAIAPTTGPCAAPVP
ncbi:MAG TPA: amidohydrolase family protein [Vitreimonas sp.]|nr:amidohydrolase family protein [Vitreimonas sp.]